MTYFHHSISVTQFPALITHHFKIPHPFGTITHLPSLNISHTVCGPHTCHSVQLFFFFSIPRNRNPVKKKKKKRTLKTEPKRRKEKKKKDWSKGAAEL